MYGTVRSPYVHRANRQAPAPKSGGRGLTTVGRLSSRAPRQDSLQMGVEWEGPEERTDRHPAGKDGLSMPFPPTGRGSEHFFIPLTNSFWI